MFTGIVSDLGEVLDVEEKAEGLRRLNIACGYDPDTIDIGASIACSGICLTVVGRGRTGNRSSFAVDAAAETLRVPAELARFIAPKGSVALDGVSLTVNKVEGNTFSILIIPHTLQVTTLGALRPGARLNLEVDQMARYAARLLDSMPHGAKR